MRNEKEILKDKETTSYLIGRLIKECENSRGYIGVEYDNLVPNIQEGETYTELLFHKILNEMVVLTGPLDSEYLDNEYNDEPAPFKSERNVRQHVVRLGKFVLKYAPKYLPAESAESFIQQVHKM